MKRDEHLSDEDPNPLETASRDWIGSEKYTAHAATNAQREFDDLLRVK
jgi:hypothetical protein